MSMNAPKIQYIMKIGSELQSYPHYFFEDGKLYPIKDIRNGFDIESTDVDIADNYGNVYTASFQPCHIPFSGRLRLVRDNPQWQFVG